MLTTFGGTTVSSLEMKPDSIYNFRKGPNHVSKSGQSAFGRREEQSVTRKELVAKLAREIRIGARVIDIKQAALAGAAARELRNIVRRHRASRRRQEGSRAARRRS
jgi:hypothetical protein